MEAAFGLEPLAGEAVGGEVAGGGVDPAEGGVGGLPDLCARRIGREDGSANVVGPHIIDRAAFDQRDGVPAVPDVFPQERPRGLVVLGDPPAVRIKHRVDRDRGGGGEAPDRLERRCVKSRTLQLAVHPH